MDQSSSESDKDAFISKSNDEVAKEDLHHDEKNDPVRLLQFSQPFYVPDTLDDDESLMIPPTQDDSVPFMIPSTPSLTEDKKEEEMPDAAVTSALKGFQSDYGSTEFSRDMKLLKTSENVSLKETSETSAVNTENMSDLPKSDLEISKLVCEENGAKAPADEDGNDEWHLQLTETESTQVFGLNEDEKHTNDELPECQKEESTLVASADTSDFDNKKPVKAESPTLISEPSAEVEDSEDEDEIEPSQTLITQYQGETLFSSSTLQMQYNESSKMNGSGREKLDEEACDEQEHDDQTEKDKEPEIKTDIMQVLEDETMEHHSKDDETAESASESNSMPDLSNQVTQPIQDSNLDVEPMEVNENIHIVIENVQKPIENDEKLKEINKTPKEKSEDLLQLPQIVVSDSSPFVVPMSMKGEKLRTKRVFDALHSDAAVMKGDLGKPKKFIGSFSDITSLENQLFSNGIILGQDQLKSIIAVKSTEEKCFPLSIKLIVSDHKLFLSEGSCKFDQEKHFHSEEEASPHSSCTISSGSTKRSFRSGDLGDVSSSLSSKSANSSGVQHDTTVNTSQLLSSQESGLFVKTSTQNSEAQGTFSTCISKILQEVKDSEQKSPKKCSSANSTAIMSPKILLSPIKSDVLQDAKPSSSSKSKKARKKTSLSSEKKPPKKYKKTKPVKRKASSEKDNTEASAKDSDTSASNQPKKNQRKKKEDARPSSAAFEKAEEVGWSDSMVDIKVDESIAESHFGNIIPGIRVMAQWTDTYYYPGMIISQELESRWKVRFEDGLTRVLSQDNILKLALLKVGTSVHVPSHDDELEYDPGLVCGHYREGTDIGYEIDLDCGGTKRFPRTSVILSADQAKILASSRPPTTPATVTINLDNIVDGKRKRKSLQSPSSSPSVTKSPRISLRRRCAADSNLDATADTSNTEKSALELETKVLDVHPGNLKKPPASKKKKSSSKTSKRASMKTNSIPPPTESNIPSGSITKNAQSSKKEIAKEKLFVNYAFLLSNAENKFKPEGSENSGEEEIIPFDKEELCLQILSEDGLILDSFEDSAVCEREHVCLLANTFLRTIKYMQCIAGGIPCVKHHWVKASILQRNILSINDFILPSGFSIITNSITEWHGKNDVLKSMKIALVSDKKSQFVSVWAPVLLAAKSIIVHKWTLPSLHPGSESFVDVLVTNSHCPHNVLQSARKRKIPIVSSEWIIQSLVAGKRLPFNAHPKFTHNYLE